MSLDKSFFLRSADLFAKIKAWRALRRQTKKNSRALSQNQFLLKLFGEEKLFYLFEVGLKLNGNKALIRRQSGVFYTNNSRKFWKFLRLF